MSTKITRAMMNARCLTQPQTMKRLLLSSTCILLTACSPQFALIGVPALADGTESRWIYSCTDHTLAVEYANRGGDYSATIDTPSGKHVLTIQNRDKGVLAVLDTWQWTSRDGIWFQLIDGKKIIFDQCRALRRDEEGNIRLNVGKLFAG